MSKVASIEDAHLCYDAPRDFEVVGRGDAFLALGPAVLAVTRLRRLLAVHPRRRGLDRHRGRADGLALWDLAAPLVIVEEAGGRFTDLDGVARADGGNAVTTNGLLHDEVLEALAP